MTVPQLKHIMSPRLRGASSTALASLEAALAVPSTASSSSAAAVRCFSSTCRNERVTRSRFEMHKWLNTRAQYYFGENSPTGSGSYLGPHNDQPFPANSLFRSQPVLSNQMKDQIYEKVMEKGMAMKAVSEEMQVDVRRVAAVVRLKQVEKQWVSDGKKLATPYAKAVMGMLPKSRFNPEEPDYRPHEPINDIPVHKLSLTQLFVPTSESRHFTREDAAKAFHETLLSADARSPQRELIDMERKVALEGADRQASLEKFRDRVQRGEERHAAKLAAQQQAEDDAITKHDTPRFQFRIKTMNASDVGRDGRSRKAVGWRYGAPLQDRKRGMVKIPTSVP